MKPYFKEVKATQFYNPKIFNLAWNPETKWVEYFNFTATPVPVEMLWEDSFYRWLHVRHPYKAGILKMEDKTMYNWHKDSNRGVCVNCMIPTPNVSYTFFRDKIAVQNKIIELSYYPGVRYIFNNQKDHMVVNYDGLRFMITLEFEANKDHLTFDQLVKDIEANYER